MFLGGDVMTGRGIDRIMPCPSPPEIHEAYVRDARDSVRLAEEANGPVPRPVEPDYIWGDALDELAKVRPAARIINLETAVSRSEFWWKGKGINYRSTAASISFTVIPRTRPVEVHRDKLVLYGCGNFIDDYEGISGYDELTWRSYSTSG